ncbi:MAG TPA: hypothetical protein VFW25_00490 [Silvibacterium sp.]|nr:hypothetical protein [Silvibacterium sp.]
MRAVALILALLAAAPPAQKAATTPAQSPPRRPQFWIMSRHSTDLLLQPVPQPNQVRLAQLKQTFNDLECRGASLRELPSPGGPNLLCILLGGTSPDLRPDPGAILIIANYEHEGAGQSAVDDWTGAITLPFLYHALTFMPRRHTFLLAEVNGAAGAKTLYDSFTPQQRGEIKGLVALDSLGLGPPQYYVNPNDSYFYGRSFLLHQLFQAASDQNIDAPHAAIPGPWFKTDVTREFRHRGIPSVVIHSVTFRTRDLPGSLRDNADAIDHEVYFQTLLLLDYYVAELDEPWPPLASQTSSRPHGGRRH